MVLDPMDLDPTPINFFQKTKKTSHITPRILARLVARVLARLVTRVLDRVLARLFSPLLARLLGGLIAGATFFFVFLFFCFPKRSFSGFFDSFHPGPYGVQKPAYWPAY